MGVDGVYVVAVAMVRLMALWYPIMSILLVVVMTMVMVVSFSPETVVSLQPMQATVKERHDIDAEEHGTDSSVDHGDCDGDDDHDDDGLLSTVNSCNCSAQVSVLHPYCSGSSFLLRSFGPAEAAVHRLMHLMLGC